MRNRFFKGIVLFLVVVLMLSGCEKRKKASVKEQHPNDAITYEAGRNFVGVIKSTDAENRRITFYNTDAEKEVVYDYSGGTEILTKNEKQISSESLEIGQVVDVYVNKDTNRLSKLQITADIQEYKKVKGLVVNEDASYIEVNDVRYRYGSGFNVFSNGEVIDIKEIAQTDEVTFRGVKGKAYSLVVTRGHGYLKPSKYKDFVGGKMTIAGMMILPVTENMLIPVPEGTYDVTMANGDFTGGRTVTIERDKQFVLDMSIFKSTVANQGQVVFDIDPVGAELYVNGTLADYSKPVTLKYGKHSVKVVLDGYTTYTGVIDVQSANPTVRISLADEEAQVEDDEETSVSEEESKEDSSVSETYDNLHKITVNAPIGASVYMDGTYMGVAPCSFSKKIGTITLTLAKDGYTTKSYTVVTLDDSEDVQWSFPDLDSTAVG